MRLDRRIRELHPELSWTRIRHSIARGQVLVGGQVARDADLDVAPDAAIDLNLHRPARPTARLDLPRLYEDEDILVVDKPAGLLTIPSHPSRRASEDTVLRRVREYATHLRGPGGYVGTLHRLDRETSGALAIALSRPAHEAGRLMFGAHAFDRVYLALVEGALAQPIGTISAPISNAYVSGRRRIANERDGRPAVTHYRTLDTFEGASLLEVRLDTGRQHQIRAHLEHIGHPLVGERVYTAGQQGVVAAPRPMLHAWKLSFPHPLHGELISTEAPLPDDFERMLTRLR